MPGRSRVPYVRLGKPTLGGGDNWQEHVPRSHAFESPTAFCAVQVIVALGACFLLDIRWVKPPGIAEPVTMDGRRAR